MFIKMLFQMKLILLNQYIQIDSVVQRLDGSKYKGNLYKQSKEA
ncbi:unnamed protein product [Paramecium pentaurelia]|uniref:Uncharacterized protein n=1 Tax=Paramecium pentaurelia TaxID=43138 RepID=A0A8S1WW40_9CILI|nr:unnamed protein product [Paramecium pentaurelia]